MADLNSRLHAADERAVNARSQSDSLKQQLDLVQWDFAYFMCVSGVYPVYVWVVSDMPERGQLEWCEYRTAFL